MLTFKAFETWLIEEIYNRTGHSYDLQGDVSMYDLYTAGYTVTEAATFIVDSMVEDGIEV